MKANKNPDNNGLLTGVIGEAVLGLKERGMLVSQDNILFMLEKKKINCKKESLLFIIEDAITWVKK